MNKIRNMISLVLFASGFLFIIGAAGESDMYEEMGQMLPLAITIKKVGFGLGMIITGLFFKGKE